MGSHCSEPAQDSVSEIIADAETKLSKLNKIIKYAELDPYKKGLSVQERSLWTLVEVDLAWLIEDTQLSFRMTSLLSSLEKFDSLRN